ncbi:MAG: hypothetical protein BWY46_01414 [Firmicutes bacterium ADurb.Bin300]|nr:MAG: hypothetical protein BWY46_01414 [Firmicutes bacterium ADurb.Bin300]
MKEPKYTKDDLKIMQAWSLERKIRVTQTKIMEWYMTFEGGVLYFLQRWQGQHGTA